MDAETSKPRLFTNPVFLTGIISGVIVALLDTFIGALYYSTTLSLSWTLPVSALLVCGLYWVVFTVCWIVVSPLIRWLNLQIIPTASTLALLLCTPIVFYSNGLMRFGKLYMFYKAHPFYGALLAISILSIWAAIVAISGYVVSKQINNSDYKNHFLRIVIAGFYVLVGIFLLIWMRSAFDMGLSMLALISFTILIVVSSLDWIFGRSGQLDTQFKIILGLILVLSLSSIYGLSTGTSQIHTSYKHEDLPRPIPKVLLLTVDSLRRDALSHYQGMTSTPNLDALAHDSMVFNRAFSAAPWTKPAMVSVLTGLSPCVHQAKDFSGSIPESYPLLSERMNAVGYTTGSVGYNFFLSRKTKNNGLQQGISDDMFLPKPKELKSLGMTLFEYLSPFRTGDRATTDDITEQSIRWIEEHKNEDFFLWVHYFDPHIPYSPPEAFLPDQKPHPRFGVRYEHHRIPAGKGTWIFDAEEVEWVKQLYLSEVRYVDDRIGMLINQMKKLGIYDESLIVMTSDHGEEFMEHFGMDHGQSLYNELLAVPLTIKLPGSKTTGAIDVPVETTAITPTILDLSEIKYDPSLLTGDSLVPHWNVGGKSKTEHPVYSSGAYLNEDGESIIFDGFKFIRYFYTQREELFELESDPGEKINRISSFPDRKSQANALLKQLGTECDALQSHYQQSDSGDVEIDERSRELLKSLGYMR